MEIRISYSGIHILINIYKILTVVLLEYWLRAIIRLNFQ